MKAIFNLLVIFLVCFCGELFGQSNPTDLTMDKSVQVFAPNAFTPNGDYNNDTWQVFVGGADIYNFHLIIFDGTGQIIWESFNVNGEWDGNHGGNEAPSGVYGWIIETKDADTDNIREFKGHITLLR